MNCNDSEKSIDNEKSCVSLNCNEDENRKESVNVCDLIKEPDLVKSFESLNFVVFVK